MEISHGCRKAERAAESMDVGQLIGHLIHCAQRLAKYAEAIEEERDPEMAKCQIVGHPVYIEAALMHLAIAPTTTPKVRVRTKEYEMHIRR